MTIELTDIDPCSFYDQYVCLLRSANRIVRLSQFYRVSFIIYFILFLILFTDYIIKFLILDNLLISDIIFHDKTAKVKVLLIVRISSIWFVSTYR